MFVQFLHREDIDKYGSHEPYLVYAVGIATQLSFAIQSEKFPSAPSFVQNERVKIVDPRLSRHWVIRRIENLSSAEKVAQISMLSFPEWAHDSLFYSRLVESDRPTTDIWRAYKAKLELEYASPNMPLAIHLEKNWYQCFSCDEAFEATSFSDEILECPKYLSKQTYDNKTQSR